MRGILNGIVKVKLIDGNYKVSGRELHKQCKVKQDFTDWIKTQLINVDAEEDNYYIVWLDKNSNLFKRVAFDDNSAQLRGAGYTQDYIIDLDIAKEICMVMGAAPRTNKETKKLSKEIRKYFIECEKYIQETNQMELFREWRKTDSEQRRHLHDEIGDDRDCIRLSNTLNYLTAYIRKLPKIYKKDELYKRYVKGEDKESWILYLSIQEKAIHFTETFMAMGVVDLSLEVCKLLLEYYIADPDDYKRYIKEHKTRKVGV